MRQGTRWGLVLTVVLLCLASAVQAAVEKGFVPLFNGRDLEGWTLANPTGRGYIVQDGLLICPADGGGNLFTAREYEDFVLRFEFRLEPGGNNGVGIRVPAGGHASRDGMEIQILDDSAARYRNLRPAQYHGSIYGVVPAKRGAQKPPGAWNQEEIRCEGRRVRVTLNGRVIVDVDLDEVTDPEVLRAHPGLMRERGHIGFLGHGTTVAFRNIRLREQRGTSARGAERRGSSTARADNRPPKGFRALFNGRDLTGWKGLVVDPRRRARMSPEELAAAQAKADQQMREHWKVVDGALAYDGKGNNLCTARDYGDFELLVDWKIHPGGDSGIYLRGTPQVQIWDRPEGSGGLFNNQKNPSQPLKKADRPPGEWNRFRIRMIGEKVTVFLNGELVVDNVTLENYWERDKPIYPTGAIELQHHGDTLHFKNIFVRELG